MSQPDHLDYEVHDADEAAQQGDFDAHLDAYLNTPVEILDLLSGNDNWDSQVNKKILAEYEGKTLSQEITEQEDQVRHLHAVKDEPTPDDASDLTPGVLVFGSVPDPRKCATTASLEHTKMGVSERVAVHYKDLLAWRPALNTWLVYDGTRWAEDPKGTRARALVRTVIRSIGQHEAPLAVANSVEVRNAEGALRSAIEAGVDVVGFAQAVSEAKKRARQQVDRFAKQTEDYSDSTLNGILDGVKVYLTRDEDLWDAHPWLVNVRNGTVAAHKPDPKNPKWPLLRPHDPRDYITKIAAVDFNPAVDGADIRRVKDHLDMQGPGTARMVFRLLGYGALGCQDAKVLAVVTGDKDAGKSTLFEAGAESLGDYAKTLDPSEFYVDKNGGAGKPRPAFDACRAARMVTLPEAEHGHMASDLLKRISGGDKVNSRTLNAPGGEWQPQFLPWFIANGELGLNVNDEALLSRLITIYVKRLPADQIDSSIKHRLSKTKEGREAVLAYMLLAARAWYVDYKEKGMNARDALLIPDHVIEARASYVDAVNPLAEWIESEVAVGTEEDLVAEYGNLGRVKASQIHLAYSNYARARGGRPMDERQFRKVLATYPTIKAGPKTEFTETTPSGYRVHSKGAFKEGIRITNEQAWIRVVNS